MHSYLESFLESLDSLPAELKRNFTLMRDLDKRAQDLIKKINCESENYMDMANDLEAKEKMERFKDIRGMFVKARELSDDKVQLSLQTYEMVDKHIRSLDLQLSKLEAELKEKILCNSNSVKEGKKKGSSKSRGRNRKSGFMPTNVLKDENEKDKKKQKLNHDTETLFLSIGNSTEVLDMPVDPNEPTYCLCHQVSYGEMVGCDNSECPIEWFHFGCVGLTAKPKGKWYCPKCCEEGTVKKKLEIK